MSKGTMSAKMNEKLINAKVKEKFKKSFIYVWIGFMLVIVLAFANILMYAKVAGVNIFSKPTRAVGILLLVLAVVFSITMLYIVAKNLISAMVDPILEIQRAVQQLKVGDFNIDIKYNSKDEMGQLADDLRDACSKIHVVITDTGYLLEEMADGNFNVSSNTKNSYIGEFASLVDSMRRLRDQMDDTLSQIRTSAEQVRVGSEQLAGSAQDLAEGATNQAGAVEELTATIGNVANISEESAENAVMAANSAKAAAEDAKRSREEINQLTEAMERITATSNEIANIIAAIEDIASQTNLLSLNASIEAARAGEAGRGFAVVADQIGKLASDSAQSAVTTRELISKCLAEVEAGNGIVENTMDSFSTVLANMENFAGMASGAADASKMQADMLQQIEAGIDQITTVVQNNSATAEETSAVSEELSAQAINLEEMVGKFRLKK